MKSIENQDSSLIKDFAQSALYAGVQTPIDGITQLVNHTADSELLPSVQLIDAPTQAEFGSASWHAQQVGGAAGMLIPFMAVTKLTRGGMNKMGLTAAESTVGAEGLWNARAKLAIAESGISGFIYDAALKPVAPGEGNFWEARLKHGLTGAATFSTLTASSIGLRGLGSSALAKATGATGLLRNEVAIGALSGVPAGLVAAESNSLLTHGRHASAKDLAQSAYMMSFVGGALAGTHQLAGQPGKHAENLRKFDPTRVSTLMESAKTKLTGLGERVDGFMASINPLLQGQPAFALVGGGRIGAADLVGMKQAKPEVRFDQPLQMAAIKEPGLMPTDRSTGISGGGGDRSGAKSEGSNGTAMEVTPEGKLQGRKSGRGNREARQREKDSERERDSEREGGAQLLTLKEVLIDQGFENIADFVSHNPKLRDQRVVRDLGNGNDSPLVVELAPSKEFPHGGALKVTIPEGGFERNWGKRSFDAKLLTKVHEVDVEGTSATAYVYVQELVDVMPRYTPDQLNDFFAKIEEAQLEWTDPGSHPTKQVGISRETGELVLIDYPCVDKAGTNETLQAIIGGKDRAEEIWEREDNAKGPLEEDKPKYDQERDVDVEQKRQDVLSEKSETDREILQQLIDGFSLKEIAEYVALTQGWTTGSKGMPDTSRAMPLVKKAKAEAEKLGLLEKSGKGVRREEDSDAEDTFAHESEY